MITLKCKNILGLSQLSILLRTGSLNNRHLTINSKHDYLVIVKIDCVD